MFPMLVTFYQPKGTWGKWLLALYVILIPFGIWLVPAGYHHQIFDINPIARIADFIIGLLLFKGYKKAKNQTWTQSERICSLLEWSALALFLIFFIFHQYIPAQYRYSSYYWPAMVFIIFIAAFQRGIISRWLSHPVLIFLGEISFGFYLLHHLVIRYFLVANEQLKIVDHPFIAAVLLLAFSILASYFSYRWIELPSNRWIKFWYKNRIAQHA
jgi:peptidoglycan/LPS O-acetylase OafA/YrhL